MTTSAVENTEAFKKYNIEVFKADKSLRSLPAIFKDVDRAMMQLMPEDRIKALRELGFEALAQKAITPLIGMSGAIETYSEKLLTMEGITKRVMKFMMTSFGAQLKMFWNNFSEVLITIGEDVQHIVLFVIKWVGKLFTAFTNLPKAVRLTLVVIATLVPVALIVAGALGSLLLAVTMAITFTTSALGIIGTLLTVLTPFLPIILGVIGGILSAIGMWFVVLSASFGGLLFWLGKVSGASGGIIDTMVAGWIVVKKVIMDAVAAVKRFWSDLRKVWTMIGGLSGAWELLKVAVMESGNIVKVLFEDALQWAKDFISQLGANFRIFLGWFAESWNETWGAIFAVGWQMAKNFWHNQKTIMSFGLAGDFMDPLHGVKDIMQVQANKLPALEFNKFEFKEGNLRHAVERFRMSVGKKFFSLVFKNLLNFGPAVKPIVDAFKKVENAVGGVVEKVHELKQGINAFDPNTVEGFRMGFLSSFLPKQKPVNAAVRNPLADLIPKPGQLMPSEKQIDEVLTGLSDKEAKLLKEQHGQTVEELRKTNTRLWDILQNIVPRGI